MIFSLFIKVSSSLWNEYSFFCHLYLKCELFKGASFRSILALLKSSQTTLSYYDPVQNAEFVQIT